MTQNVIRENLSSYQGQNNVSKLTNTDTGSISYLTSTTSFADEAYRLGASKLNSLESEKKHVFFLFNAQGAELGRYYMTKSLQGKTPQQLLEMRTCLVFFKSFNPNTNSWVPCVAKGNTTNLADTALSF